MSCPMGAAMIPKDMMRDAPKPQPPKILGKPTATNSRRSLTPKEIFSFADPKKMFGSQRSKKALEGGKVEEVIKAEVVKDIFNGELNIMNDKNHLLPNGKKCMVREWNEGEFQALKDTVIDQQYNEQDLEADDGIEELKTRSVVAQNPDHSYVTATPDDETEEDNAKYLRDKKGLLKVGLQEPCVTDIALSSSDKDAPSIASLKSTSTRPASSYLKGDETEFAARKRLPRDSYHQYLNKFVASDNSATAHRQITANIKSVANSIGSFDSEAYSFRSSDDGFLSDNQHSPSVAGSGHDQTVHPLTAPPSSGPRHIASSTSAGADSAHEVARIVTFTKPDLMPSKTVRSQFVDQTGNFPGSKQSNIDPGIATLDISSVGGPHTASLSAPSTVRPDPPASSALADSEEKDCAAFTEKSVPLQVSFKGVTMYPVSRTAALDLLLLIDDSKDVQICFISRKLLLKGPRATTQAPASNSEDDLASLPSALANWLISFGAGEAIPEDYELKAVDSDGKKYYARGPFTPDWLSNNKTRNSSANVTIEELCKRYPQLQSDLEALQTSIKELERNVRLDGVFERLKLKSEIDEMVGIMQAHGGQATEVAAIVKKCRRKVESAEAKVEDMLQQMMHLNSVRHGWETQFNSANRELESQALISTDKISNLEREKRHLMEKNNYLEERLETERLRTNSAERAKSSALASTNNMRKHFDFYRNYYEAQVNVHAQYLGSGTRRLPSVEKPKQIEEALLTPQAIEDDVREVAVKTAIVKFLTRTMYKNLFAAHEFCASLDAGSKSQANETKNEGDIDENSTLAEDSDESKASTPETKTTFTSNFLGMRH